MRIPDPPTYSVGELERHAASFIAERLGPNPAIPIDIDLMLEELPGVDLDYGPKLRDNHYVEGMVARDPDSGKFVVLIDDDLANSEPTRYRMTVAEELAHLVLHREQIEAVREPSDFRELQRHHLWHQMERNAKRFGAAVLMPGRAVATEAREIYRELVAVVGYTNADAVRRKLTALMRNRFNVSYPAMLIRLGEWPMRVFANVDEAMANRMDFWD